MTTPTPARRRRPTTIEIADRNRDWQATTDEALARHRQRRDDHQHPRQDPSATAPASSPLPLTVLEQLAERLAAPCRGRRRAHSDPHPTRTIPGRAHTAGNHAHLAGKSALKRPTSS